MTYYIDIMDL